MKKLFFIFLFVLMSISVIAVSDDAPVGLQKIGEYNKNSTLDFAKKVWE